MEHNIVIKFPILGKGNPLKNAARFCDKLKKELEITANLSNADSGEFDASPEPYSLECNNVVIWSGKEMNNDEAFTALKNYLKL